MLAEDEPVCAENFGKKIVAIGVFLRSMVHTSSFSNIAACRYNSKCSVGFHPKVGRMSNLLGKKSLLVFKILTKQCKKRRVRKEAEHTFSFVKVEMETQRFDPLYSEPTDLGNCMVIEIGSDEYIFVKVSACTNR